MHFVFKLRGTVKCYEWGKPGSSSFVAQLYKTAFPDFQVCDNTPYAELWLGTHSSGCSTIPEFNDMKLSEWLKQNSENLGSPITTKFGSVSDLPFLFKVLSVNKALSIQVHPDKKTAEMLHKSFPDRYPDANHKPEIAIALTNFEAMCGFRPSNEINIFLSEITQLQKIIGFETVKNFQMCSEGKELKELFTSMMTCSADVYQPLLAEVVENFKSNKYKSELCTSLRDIFLRVSSEYPGDIGCFSMFLFNYLKLKPGEAIFLAANVPHAYLYGDCIECMACSDNVVRAGLTPKFKDVETLCNILSYEFKSADENKFPCLEDTNDPCLRIFTPPVKDFAVHEITVPTTQKLYSLKVMKSASLLLVIRGDAVYKCEGGEDHLSSGRVLFICSGSKVDLVPSSDLLMFRAYCSD